MIEAACLAAAAAALYCYAGYPLLIRGIAALAGADPPQAPPGWTPPTVSILIAAYDEETTIAGKIRGCCALEHPAGRMEIVIVSDGSADRTVSRAREAAAAAPAGTRVLVLEDPRRRGKALCINDAAAASTGDVLVFTDANSRLGTDSLRWLLAPFSDPRTGCVVGELEYENTGDPAVRRGEGLYWRYDNAIKQAESRLGRAITANGGLYALRRNLFAPLPPHLSGDALDPLRALCAGYRCWFERRARAAERAAESFREEYGRKLRITTHGLQAWVLLRGLLWPPRPLLAWEYFSHKLLRWVMPAILAAWLAGLVLLALPWPALPRLFPLAVWRGALGAALLFLLLAAAGLLLERRGARTGAPGPAGRLALVCGYFVVVNAAAAMSLLHVVGGVTLPTWEKSASTRPAGS